MEMREPDFTKAEAASIRLLDRYGVDDPGFDILDLAYVLGVDVEYGGIENADAWLLRRRDGRGVIRLNSNIQEPARKRFSIAHEIGHWIMHPNLQQGFLCAAQDFQDYARSPEEAEANWFAATLLLPKSLLPKDQFNKDPCFEIVRKIAFQFQTSLTATARRYVELSKFSVILVSSTNGEIKWSIASKCARRLFLPWGGPLPDGSLTLESFKQGLARTSQNLILPEIWFPSRKWDRDAELFEQARYSAEYNNSLTLLWLP
ncbi:MAG: ImmA/IrrE family metallo-endopeptidase [Opitutales bacterium]|nr:ImmA/IrrE family metallo-endopeptidase [Opitutales bacterium]